MHAIDGLRRPAAAAWAVLLASVLFAAAARAEVAPADTGQSLSAPEDADPQARGALSIRFDSTFTTAYLWRGVINQRDGLIWQPSVELSMNLFGSADGWVRSVDAGVGTWLTLHTEDAGAYAPGTDGLYETDYYPNLGVEWAGGLTTALTYYFYTSPNDSFDTIEELAVDLAWDDSEVFGAWAMNPTATLSFETKRSAFGDGKGASLEFGIEPGAEVTLPFDGAGNWPVGVTVPLRLGLSIDSYYDDGVRDETFGYFLFGLHASVPVACVPARFGQLSLTNGFDMWVVNDAIEAYTSDEFGVGDPVYPVWTTSLTLEH